MNTFEPQRKKPSTLLGINYWKSKSFTKIYKWEFWPFWFFYIPIYFYWFFLAIKARALFFFSAANPLMELGGFSNYSKYNVLKYIPKKYLPKTVLLPTPVNLDALEKILVENELTFPLIAKPDRGERGIGVNKLDNLAMLTTYLQEAKEAIILQEYVSLPLEFGVMYFRLPDEAKGRISSLVLKEFLTVIGNGKSSVAQLLKANDRFNLFYDKIAMKYPHLLDMIPAEEERMILEPIGNHNRGTIFLNVNHLITPQLAETFDTISQSIEGFYFGRYDLKVDTFDNLQNGINIKIMELNGANSEPAHIYDPQMPIWKAYRDLFEHWRNLYRVSVQNARNGVPYMRASLALQHIRDRKSVV